MPGLFSFRNLCLGGFAVCGFAMAFALYMQHKGYEPCPMCIFQRVAMIAAGAFFLLGALHNPKWPVQWAYAALADLAAIAGALIAARHVWLQNLPPDQVPACGPTLDYLMGVFPLSDVVVMILKGDGNCAKIDAAWMGISLPAWTMISFIALSIYASLMPVIAKFSSRHSRASDHASDGNPAV